jgi:hypothetical protein
MPTAISTMPAMSRFLRATSARAHRDANVLGLVDVLRGHHDADDSDRQVDVEDPRPRVVVRDPAAEHRADGGADHDDHREQGHRHALLFRRERLAQDRLLRRLQRAAAEALDHAPHDQRRQRTRRAAHRRCRDEHEIDSRYTRFCPKKPPRKPVSGITSTIAIM